MTPSAAFSLSARDMADHSRAARRVVADSVEVAAEKPNTPGPPVDTGRLIRSARRNFNPARWPGGKTWKRIWLAPYALFHAIKTSKTSKKNPRGFLVTVDEAAQAAFSIWRWRRSQ